MESLTNIYVALLDEGVDVWRPVEAIHLHDEIYQVVGVNRHPEDEQWQFTSGNVVGCRNHRFADGTEGAVAYEIAGEI